MKSYKLSYYSASSMEINSLSHGVQLYQKQNGSVRVLARTQTQLFDNSRIDAFVRASLDTDAIIISLHGGKESCPAFDALIDAMKESSAKPYIHIQPTGGDKDAMELARLHADGFGEDSWDQINRYLIFGGHINFHNLLIYLHNLLFQTDHSFKLPIKLPHEGIYHPDMPGIPELNQYLEERIDPEKPTVGMWFNQIYWLNNNLLHIDAIIRDVEKKGANIIPVFHLRYKDVVRENKGADYIVEHFFMKNGAPRIDVLISPMMFSLILADPNYKDLLPKLGVPCIQAMTTMQPCVQWKESVQGMSTMEVSYCAAQPEFDGNLITVPIASREQEEIDPLTGALITKYIPVPDRVQKMVDLSLNWARLRKKDNSSRRIAVIFHHYPPRNDRIGCAAGLDSFESVKLLLDDMKAKGYVIDRTFDSGNALAQEILTRMTYDQRWLLPEQMYERAEARANRNNFLPWHKDLPEAIKEKMISDWGDMPGDIFVHNDEMMFTGLLNGNVFISVQPPRGYFENIDKIYHDMYLSSSSLSCPV